MTDDTPVSQTHRPVAKAVWAAIISVVFPGLGHIYVGAWHLGLAIIAFVIVADTGFLISTRLLNPSVAAVAVIVGVGTFGIGIGLRLGTAIDAARRAMRRPVWPKPPWQKRTWTAFFAVVAVTIPIIMALPMEWGLYHIPNGSDIPTILIGDYIVTRKTALAPPMLANKVIVFRPPGQNSEWLKRVVALPGDTVQIHGGILYINFKPASRSLEENYVAPDADGSQIAAKRYVETMPDGFSHNILKYSDEADLDPVIKIDANNTPAYLVPAGDVFVLGDNRDDSIDSRFPNIGPIPIDRIVGVASVIVWAKDWSRIEEKVR